MRDAADSDFGLSSSHLESNFKKNRFVAMTDSELRGASDSDFGLASAHLQRYQKQEQDEEARGPLNCTMRTDNR